MATSEHPDNRRTSLRAGIYAPLTTFFIPDTEDLDLSTLQKHAVMLAQAGLVGLVTMGSNGEAVHLTRTERSAVTRAVRDALDTADFHAVPIIVGASEQSVRGTIELCLEAHAAGGEYVLLMPPSYYRQAIDQDTIRSYYTAVADASPAPVLIYNYPGAVAGIDMDSDLLISLARHPNIIGAKFTCGNIGKLTRVALATNAASARDEHGALYFALGGFADFTAQTAASGGSGIIAGSANVLPKLSVRIWDLWRDGKYDQAIDLQKVLSKGDWELTKTGVPGTKSALESYYGYGGAPRRPLAGLTVEQAVAVKTALADAMAVERAL